MDRTSGFLNRVQKHPIASVALLVMVWWLWLHSFPLAFLIFGVPYTIFLLRPPRPRAVSPHLLVVLLIAVLWGLWKHGLPLAFLLIWIPFAVLFPKDSPEIEPTVRRSNPMTPHLGLMLLLAGLWALWIIPGAFPLMGLPAALLLELVGVEVTGDGGWNFILMVECAIPAFGIAALIATYLLGFYMKADTIPVGGFVLTYAICLVLVPIVVIGGFWALSLVLGGLGGGFVTPL